MFGLQPVTPPSVEPVTLAQAKAFANVASGFTLDDDLITGLISAARAQAETYTHRCFFNQQWRMSLDRFPIYWGRSTVKNTTDTSYPYNYYFEGMSILLPKARVVSVDSITYYDASATQQTLDPLNYFLDNDSEPGRLIPSNSMYWPTVSVFIPGNVKITYTVGSYGDGVEVNTCPSNVVTAIEVLTAHFYANREGNAPIPDAFYRLLDSERVDVFTYFPY